MRKLIVILSVLVAFITGILVGKEIFIRDVFISYDDDDFQKQENLVGVVWQGLCKTGLETVKSWNAQDGKEILNMLLKAETGEYAFNKEYKLTLFFYDTKTKRPKVFETWFSLFGKKFISEEVISGELFEFFNGLALPPQFLIPPGFSLTPYEEILTEEEPPSYIFNEN